MKNSLAISLLLLSSSALAQEDTLQECKILVDKAWIVMGTTSLEGCFKFVESNASPNERIFGKFGDGTDLQVNGDQRFKSFDGGGAWQPVGSLKAGASMSTLNVLQEDNSQYPQPQELAQPPSTSQPQQQRAATATPRRAHPKGRRRVRAPARVPMVGGTPAHHPAPVAEDPNQGVEAAPPPN